ncbi:MAG: protein kinase [Planctomycetes bacterium]|nr:protein kinase [Planctomycetota bacterium]
MQSSFTCLPPDELKKFIAGNMPPQRIDEVEDHLSTCQLCRTSLEATVGDQAWWQELQSALSSDSNDCEIDNAPSKDNLTQRLAALLGPTDNPSMLGRIGSYEIIGLLGYGGMGAVFKAHDPGLNRYVAIKILLPHLALSGAARARFRREGQAAAAIIDDCVLPIYVVDEWQGIPYLVMQYTRGVSLQKRIHDRGPLELKEILRIGLQAARGLAAAHAQGLVHRDVKPSNILLDGSVDRAFLTDFGLARAVDDASLTASGIIAGTPQYMSPEQARAESVDHRSDLFSLGSVMYAMCTGHAPFRAESSYAVLRLITDKDPRPIRELNPDIPEWFVEIITKLMEKRVERRYQSAVEAANVLRAGLAYVQNPIANPCPVTSPTIGLNAQGSFPSVFIGGSNMIYSKFVWGIMLLFGMAMLAFAFQPLSESDQKALAELKGEWVLQSMTRGGVAVPADQLFNEQLVFDSAKFVRLQTKPNGEELRGESGQISVGTDQDHRTMDFHLSMGTIHGIYEITDDKLVLCITREGGARPDSLASLPNDQRVLQHFTRSAKVATAPATEQPPQDNSWINVWLKKIPAELPKDAADAQKWMTDNNFDSISTGELTEEIAQKINPDINFQAYAQMGATTYLYGRLRGASLLNTSPSIEVYCFVDENNKVVSMQVTPTSIKAVPLPNLRSHIVLVREAEASGKEANQKPILFKGVIIDSEGYIAVPMLPEMAKTFVVTIGNQQETKGELVAVDESYRIGLIKISLNEPLPALGFNSDYKPQVSDKALIVPVEADESVRRGQITSVEFSPSEESQANFILCDIACPLSMFGSLLVSEDHIPLGIVLASRVDFAPRSLASGSHGLEGKPMTVAVPLPAIATLLQAARSNPKAALVRIPTSREVDLDKPVAITLEPIAPQAKSIVESFADRGAKILEYVEGKRLKVQAPPQIIAEINKALQSTIRPATEGGSNRNEEPNRVSQVPSNSWLDKLQGDWDVEQKYLDSERGECLDRFTGKVVGNRVEFVSVEDNQTMIFDLIVGDAGPPQQLDMKAILSENDRNELLKPWKGTAETPPESITNPVFYAIIEGDSTELRICNHEHPGEARPIQFTDKGGRVIWKLTRRR